VKEEGVSAAKQTLEERSINTIRGLAIDAVERANSGHPGLPLGAAPMAYVLWQRHLRHNPRNPAWPDRDRFVLSGGHGSMLPYALLHLTGYPVTMDDLRQFRQWGSHTPGHPEFRVTPGIEATTGPLGQGLANAVGMAIAERHLAHRFNRPGHTIVDHRTYVLCSDGDMMEGVAAEAASVAGHLRLSRMVVLYDANEISLDGPTSLTFTEDVGARFKAYGWDVRSVADADHDLKGIDAALRAARENTERPSLIILRTTIGFGSPNKAGTYQVHGSPLGAEEAKLTKKALGLDPETAFAVADDVRQHFETAIERGSRLEEDWRARFAAYQSAHADLAEQWRQAMGGELPPQWDGDIPNFDAGEKLATREASGKVMNAIAARVPSFLGGDADLSSSTKTALKGGGSFDGTSGSGRNLHYGVREHAMGAISNGLAYHGGVRAFASTFFVFSDYMRPPVRLAAMNGLPVIYVWTHDSVALGEDGPTHQPIEHLASLRALPNLIVLRPADANETAEAWRFAMGWTEGPVALVLTRQKVSALPEIRDAAHAGVPRGAYVVVDAEGGGPDAVIVATGSEVAVAMEARSLLHADGVRARVVSMPSWELFERQSGVYQESVLAPAVAARVSVEAGATLGWSRYLGPEGRAIGIDRFGASAPAAVNMEKFGLTAEQVAATVRELVHGSMPR
jgi:transketolase